MPDRSSGRTVNDKPDDDAARQSPPDRITVALIPKAGADLQVLQNRTNLSKTDVVNRAITLYEFIDQQIRSGQELLIRDDEKGQTQIVKLL